MKNPIEKLDNLIWTLSIDERLKEYKEWKEAFVNYLFCSRFVSDDSISSAKSPKKYLEQVDKDVMGELSRRIDNLVSKESYKSEDTACRDGRFYKYELTVLNCK